MAETKHVKLTWQHDMVFSGVGAAGVPITLDAGGPASVGPMEALLLSLAACTGADVYSILVKKRVAPESFSVDVAGDRRSEHPKRYIAIRLTFRLKAAGLTEAAAVQAIELSMQKYCSVRNSLDPAIPISYELVLEA